ncbi:MAG: sigma-54 dependent transcriptional regulator [Bacteroidia bacterium]|nr:sigma-54 dependent transcriptional regulator [Bacteroidia bacterium]
MSTIVILIVDDEEAQRSSIAGFLLKKGYSVHQAASGTQAVDIAASTHLDLVLTDFRMPDMTGGDVLHRIREINPDIPVVVVTAYGSIESAVGLMRQGAFDYIQKPVDLDELLLVIERAHERSHLISENRQLREQLAGKASFANIVSQSAEMETVLNTAARVAESKASVLIRGESGTGKELIARTIHLASDRRDMPFVVINCAAIPETLFESELFGHEKGAYTGAERQRIGKFEQADGGTLFIDEAGDIPPAIQVKLLRALQFGEIQRLGSNDTLHVDTRIIAATNRPLEDLIRDGSFREDLYYRLNVVTITLPPLRQRKADIGSLTQAFVRTFAEQNGKRVSGVSREAMDMLLRYDYPGNIRELENIIQRAVVLAREEIITTGDLPPNVQLAMKTSGPLAMGDVALGDLNDAVERLEDAMIEKALQESGGNQVRAAALLNISERTLRYKLSRRKNE